MKTCFFLLSSTLILLLWSVIPANSQTFTNSNNLLNGQNFHSGGCTGVVDMDQDGLDDILILDESENVFIAYQLEDGGFVIYNYGSVSGSGQWGMCAADVDNNGHNDIFSGGSYDGVHLLSIASRDNGIHSDLQQGSMFMQGCNLVDINNDGWLDAFGCHDDAESRIWGNDGAGNLLPANEWIDMATTPPSDNSGNYGSVWCDFDNDRDIDLFIAKCRQFVSDPYDPRRINMLFVNDSEANFDEDALDRGLVHYEQSWTADFADIDNDGDFDCLITTHSATLKLYENDGKGYFTDITSGSGLEVSGFFLQAKMADFDNDGWMDLLYAGGTQGYFHNNGNNTFTLIPNTFPYDDTMHSFGVGDLNRDGLLDVYASYGNGYNSPDDEHEDVLWINTTQTSNNWIGFTLEGTVSNRNAVGARIEIYGDFGMQIREVRAGESYGITTSFAANFGLGNAADVDLVVVKWPSGIINVLENPTISEYTHIIETECDAQAVQINADGDSLLCQGESVSLSTDAVGNFLWSTGASSAAITASDPGNYNVLAYENGCGGLSNTIAVEVVVDEVPEVVVSGELEFCEGYSVDLIAPASSDYLWSNGSTSQVLTVQESGLYSVSIMGICNQVNSENIEVVVFDAPDAPLIENIVLDEAGSVTFNGASENLLWYLNEDDTEPTGTGASWQSPFITESTTFWVEDAILHGAEIAQGAKVNRDATGAYHNNSNFYLLFDVHENILLRSVKVFANGAGNRSIEVVNNMGQVVASGVFTIPDGESRVELNFTIPAGMHYGIRTVGDPQLWRDGLGSVQSYPYAVGDFVTITGTNINGNNQQAYYYFFFEWEVSNDQFACVGERVPVQVIVTSLDEPEVITDFRIYPIPASDFANVEFITTHSGLHTFSLFDTAGKLIWSKTISVLANSKQAERLDIRGLSSGLYTLVAEKDGIVQHRRIAVE
jgi:hypothetical protein